MKLTKQNLKQYLELTYKTLDKFRPSNVAMSKSIIREIAEEFDVELEV